jgi:hypothetical protein
MFMFREILNCKPGKVRPMVEKLQVISAVAREMGSAVSARTFTDVSGEPFWTVVTEIEVETLDAFFEMEKKMMTNPTVGKAMADYHDLVVSGRREILRLEG